jgi:catechol 2,3-dioxygenase-like lactoylglutathione lyase family enzyme
MSNTTLIGPDAACAVNNLIPFAHVADVPTSAAFYGLLGFSVQREMKDPPGRTFWARLRSGQGEIMFAAASGPIDAHEQAVLFYMYSENVADLRRHLLAAGLHDASTPGDSNDPHQGRRVVFEITHPHYMPAGELRLHDPDGYVILVGQLA